jgi:hypothetical protein
MERDGHVRHFHTVNCTLRSKSGVTSSMSSTVMESLDGTVVFRVRSYTSSRWNLQWIPPVRLSNDVQRSRSPEEIFDFMKSLGNSFIPSYLLIFKCKSWGSSGEYSVVCTQSCSKTPLTVTDSNRNCGYLCWSSKK